MSDLSTVHIQAYHRGVLSTALAALTGSSDGHMIAITGRSAKGDGGEGLVRWDASDSSTTDDGATVWGAGPGRWKRVFDGSVVDPAWFGAKGDGSNNDTTAIQAAIASLSTYSGIDFKSRTYYLGTRSGATDAPLRLLLSGLSDKTLHSDGATFTLQTTSQTLGYTPVMFRMIDCHRIGFVGKWQFKDTKTWSTYTTYGQQLSTVPDNWSGFSGAHAIWVNERCTDLTFGDLNFHKTRFGLYVGGTDGVTPADADRSSRISVASIFAEDVSYPFGLAENGDDTTCLAIHTLNCMRGFIIQGVTNVRVFEHKRNSIRGFQSVVSRRERDTANIDVEMRYFCEDGYPYQPLYIGLTPTVGTGTPYIKGCRVKLSCKLKTLDATREQQAACIIALYDTSGVETDLSAYPDCIRGLELDIDKGEFGLPFQVSPTSNTTTSYPKLKMKLKLRDRTGGTYDTGISAVDNTAYVWAKKVAVDHPVFYEMVSSDTVEASYVYPVSGWGPWQDSTPSNISLTNHTCHWRWVRIGAMCHYSMTLTLGSGSIPAGNWYFRLPYVPTVDGVGSSAPPLHEFGDVTVKDVSTGDIYKGHLKYNGGSYYPQIYLKTKESSSPPVGPLHVVPCQRMADVSAASTVYGVAPAAGTIVKIYSILGGPITGADANLTASIGSTAITNGTWTVANAGSANGDIDSCTPTALNVVVAGDSLKAASDGASSTTAPLDVFFIIREAGTITNVNQAVTATNPFTFASGDTIRITCSIAIDRVL